MHIYAVKPSTSFLLSTVLVFAAVGSGCQTAPVTNTNANVANTNTTSLSNLNANTAPGTGATIEAREPDTYRATLTLRVATTGEGQQSVATPPLTAEVAREGTNRRISFTIPGGEQVIYLDRAEKRYVIVPNRKQYAELTPQSTGFEVPRVMTPGQIVDELKSLQGYERVGEETYQGRPAIKYRFAGTAQTGTQAGQVETEAFVYVDRETGLPLHSETVAESQSGNVKGIKGLKLVTEMSNIQTNVDPSMFEVPQGYSKVPDQQVRQQVDAVVRTALAIAGQVLQSMSTQGGTTAASPSPTVSPSPAR
ncbi:MAG TPA: hypothetical protein VD966_11185 [Pyrinomonadaceae bacterium]|nr:hypothetical protein [Pyrinomonadaceae bacterium]